MITKSGIDSRNFEYKSSSEVAKDLANTYTANVATGLYVLENANGMEVCITNVGGRIVSCLVPDKNGNFKDVVLGFDNLESYIAPEQDHSNFQGAIVGRYANRIANGKFNLDGKIYNLPVNNGTNCLHGGPFCWSFQTFNVEEYDKENNKLILTLNSPDGDMGFPGNVKFRVIYELFNDNSLHINYFATTDAPTVINITNHSYFNLSGDFNKTTLDDTLFICAQKMTPLNTECCPNGQIVEIEKEGPFDFYGANDDEPKYFKNGKRIGQDISADDEQIRLGNGYDHNYVIKPLEDYPLLGPTAYDGDIPYCAKLFNQDSGITLEIYTTQPGVQLYDSVDLDGTLIGKNGILLKANSGVCLETQHFANSPNIADYPSTVLRPDEEFNSKTIYKFS